MLLFETFCPKVSWHLKHFGFNLYAAFRLERYIKMDIKTRIKADSLHILFICRNDIIGN